MINGFLSQGDSIAESVSMSWCHHVIDPDSKVHGANMGPTWVLSAPGGPHVGPMNLAIWGDACLFSNSSLLGGTETQG